MIQPDRILTAAADLLGDDLESIDSEYVRAITELVAALHPDITTDVVDFGGDDFQPFVLSAIFASNVPQPVSD